MRFLLALVAVVLTQPFSSLRAGPATAKRLHEYSEKFAFIDNLKEREKLKENLFHAEKKSDKDYFYVFIEAFPGPDTFKQVALTCRACRYKYEKHPEICNKEFGSLFAHLLGDEGKEEALGQVSSSKLKEILERLGPNSGKKIYLKLARSDVKIRLIASNSLYCDGAGGEDLRFDLFLE